MPKLSLKFRGKTIKTFNSICQLFIYAIDLFSKFSLLALVVFAGITDLIVQTYSKQLSLYIYIYIIGILCWGLLLVKFILCGKKVFSKTRYDIFFMGLISLSLISVLASDDRVRGVFGASQTWSFSVITFLSLSIIYYLFVLFFRYPRGIKWISLSLVFASLVPGIYYLTFVLKGETIYISDYLSYIVLSIPLVVSTIFIFRKIYLRVFAGLALIVNLILVAYYSKSQQVGLFVLSIAVLALFVLFYVSFWIKNSLTVMKFLQKVFSNISNIKETISKNKKEVVMFLIIIFMAIWIIGFGSYSLKFSNTAFSSVKQEQFVEDLKNVSGVRMWLIGENDLSRVFSDFEILNILANYGVFGVLILISFFGFAIYQSAKLTLSLLYSASWRNIVFTSSIFITLVAIFAYFLFARVNPMVHLLFLSSIGFLSIVQDLLEKTDLYMLQDCLKAKDLKMKIFRTVLIILILGITIFGTIALLSSIQKDAFWR